MTTLTASPLDLTDIRRAVDTTLTEFLDAKARSTNSPVLLDLTGTLRAFLASGGKRLRPTMCVCGWYAAGGSGDLGPVLRVAASLELFHAFALIHDDVMDNSDTRRGRPTVHRALAGSHHAHRDAERFGASAAILLGDLAQAWSDELLHSADLTLPQWRAALPALDTMRTEVMLGQYLDLLASGTPAGDVRHALMIARLKTAKYTVERPLQLGAALATAPKPVLDACTAYALPIGEAFQLRDDLLGVFGDPAATGKSTVDDLREGKCTALMALALVRADPGQLRVLRELVGRPDLDEEQARAVRAVLEATRARHEVENMITKRYRKALRALDSAPFPGTATATLRQLARAASARTS